MTKLNVTLNTDSDIVWVVFLGLQVGEAGEGARPQSMQLILEEADLLALLLDNVSELQQLSRLLDLLVRVVRIVLVLARFEFKNLLPRVDRLLQLAGFLLKLTVLTVFLLDLVLQLLLRLVDCLDTLRTGLLQLADLVLQPLLVVLVLLDVLALDNLLSLLRDTIQLDIFSSFGIIQNL